MRGFSEHRISPLEKARRTWTAFLTKEGAVSKSSRAFSWRILVQEDSFVLGRLRKARSKEKPKPRSKAKARSKPKSKGCLRYCACDSGARYAASCWGFRSRVRIYGALRFGRPDGAFRTGFPGVALGTLQSMVIICDKDAPKRPECRVRSHSGILSRGENYSGLGFCRDGVSGHVQTARLKRLYRKKVAGNRRYRAQNFICARNTVPGARLREIWISREAGFARSRSRT